MEKRPFDGVNVIDFTWSGAGPFNVNWLAFHGATVLRIESASQPDPVRRSTQYGAHPEDKGGLEYGGVFAFTHPVKKLDLSLNLKHAKGKEIFKRLIASWANVFIESFPTGTVERLGFGYDELKKIKSDIIMFSTCGYGHTGPMANQPGFGMTVSAPAGFYNISGWPDRPSVPISNVYTDLLSPLLGGVILIAAINHWRRTGEGQHIELAQVEAGINFLGPVILDYTVNQRELALTGNKLSYAAPHGAYRCRGNDRWVAIGVFTDEEWEAFCQTIGNLDLVKDTKFSTLTNRIKNSDELDELINKWTVNYTAEEVMKMMQDNGVRAGVVANAQDVESDPQLKHYDFFRELDHPYLGKLNFYHPPAFKLSKDAADVHRPPLLGEDNDYICTKILGMSDEEIVTLIQDGVLE